MRDECVGEVEQRHPPLVLGVHVSPVVQEELHHSHAVVAGRKVQRRGVAAVQISTVDRVGMGGYELLWLVRGGDQKEGERGGGQKESEARVTVQHRQRHSGSSMVGAITALPTTLIIRT